MAEIAGNLFNLDNRIFRTLKALAIPGKLSEDYFEGKHVRYYHPVRLFLVAGAVFITLFSIRIGSEKSQIMPVTYKERQLLHQKHQIYLHLDSLKNATAASLQNQSATAALDTLMAKLDSSYKTPENDSIRFILSFVRNSSKDTVYTDGSINFTFDESRTIEIAVDDIENMSEDSLLQSYGVHGFWGKLLVRQQLKLHKKGENFLLYVLGNTLWMMLIMMPMLALVLKLLYIRRNYYYLEHLIFSFHVHSFLFLLFTFVLLFETWLGNSFGTILGIAWFIAAIYPFFAMKRFYKQGWIKSFVKYSLSSMLYIMIFVFALIGLALLSFTFF